VIKRELDIDFDGHDSSVLLAGVNWIAKSTNELREHVVPVVDDLCDERDALRDFALRQGMQLYRAVNLIDDLMRTVEGTYYPDRRTELYVDIQDLKERYGFQ